MVKNDPKGSYGATGKDRSVNIEPKDVRTRKVKMADRSFDSMNTSKAMTDNSLDNSYQLPPKQSGRPMKSQSTAAAKDRKMTKEPKN